MDHLLWNRGSANFVALHNLGPGGSEVRVCALNTHSLKCCGFRIQPLLVFVSKFFLKALCLYEKSDVQLQTSLWARPARALLQIKAIGPWQPEGRHGPRALVHNANSCIVVVLVHADVHN